MKNNQREKRYFSIKETSLYTGLAAPTLYEWAALRKIPSIKVGRRILFDIQAVDAFLANLQREPDQIADAVKKLAGDKSANDV